MRLHRSLVALLSVAALAACDKNAVRDLTGPVPSAEIRFFNFGVNAPSVQFYAGDRKMTATTSASCQSAQNPPVTATDSTCLTIGIQASTGIAYGSAAARGLYVGIEPGQYTLAGRTASTSNNGTAVSSLPVTVEAGKRYSYYQSGFYDTTTKTVDAFLLEDDFPATIDWTTSLVRFVNAIGNSVPMALVAVNTVTGAEYPIGSEVAYTAAGAFASLPPGSYDLRTRAAGSTTDLIVRTVVPFEAGHVYTITARGDMTVTSGTATNRPFLDNTANR